MVSQTRAVNNVITGGWTDADKAFADDDQCTYTNSDMFSNRYNFINNPFSIPAGATIDGLQIRIRYAGDGTDRIYIWLYDAAISTLPKIGTPPVATCANAVMVSGGGPTDLWSGNWTPAHINSADFHAHFMYTKEGKASIMYVDYFEVIVYYTLAGVPYAANVRLIGTVIAPYSTQVRNIGAVIAPFSALVRLIGSVYRSYSARARLIGVVALPFSAQVRNIGSVYRSFSAQVRNIGKVVFTYSSRARLIGVVALPFSAQVRNIGTIIIPYSALVRLVGTVIAPFSAQVRNIGILLPLVAVAKCHAELKARIRRSL